MEQKRDILDNKELRKMPYSVPDGYFAAKPAQMADIVRAKSTGKSTVRRFMPYVAVAASFLLLIAGGSFFLRDNAQAIPETDYYSDAQLYNGLSEDDMIAYLIHSGAHVEEFADLFSE